LNFRLVITYAAIAFVVWWVIQEPSGATQIIRNIGTSLMVAANGLSHFVASI